MRSLRAQQGWIAWVLAATLACHGGSMAAFPPRCRSVAVDTVGWQRLHAKLGAFTILLPEGATELPVQCIDTACGMVRVGTWVLDYDVQVHSREYSPSGLPMRSSEGSECTEPLHEGSALVKTFRYSNHASDAGDVVRGKLAGLAEVRVSPERSLYLSMTASSLAERDQFLAALRTLEMR